MHAVVSVIDPEHYTLVEALWEELEMGCGLAGIRATPIPHFSWHIAESYDFETLQVNIREIAGSLAPFSIRTGGLGLFTRENPVVYFPIVRTGLLSEIHRTIWETVSSLSQNPSPYYDPDFWFPHITLAHGDVSPTSLNCMLEKLAFQSNTWEISIDNLAVVSQLEKEVGDLRYQVLLAG